jgi:anti-anti-sigma factor
MSPGNALRSGPERPAPAEPAVRPFRIIARPIDRRFRELKVQGELDLAVSDRLKHGIAEATGSGILVDLSECTFIDSAGVAAVVFARLEGEHVAIHSPSEPVRRVLSLTGVTGDGLVFDGREEAMRGLLDAAADG